MVSRTTRDERSAPFEMMHMSELTEEEIVESYVKWARANAIPVMECDVEDIEEYMMRFLKAAG